MSVIAQLPNANSEFSAQEIVEKSKSMEGKDFSPSHSVQMLKFLSEKGLIFKNKHGKYLFAVPLMSDFINRQLEICSH
jgi:hypothetical protein